MKYCDYSSSNGYKIISWLKAPIYWLWILCSKLVGILSTPAYKANFPIVWKMSYSILITTCSYLLTSAALSVKTAASAFVKLTVYWYPTLAEYKY